MGNLPGPAPYVDASVDGVIPVWLVLDAVPRMQDLLLLQILLLFSAVMSLCCRSISLIL